MTLYQAASKAIMEVFPLSYGHTRLRRVLAKVPQIEGLHTRKLRGYPLQMTFNPNSYMGWFLYYRGMYEEQITRTCASLLSPGMVFADVGANYGLYTLIAAYSVGDTGRVIAFEPQRQLLPVIQHNLEQNGLRHVVVKHCAIGHETGAAELHQPAANNEGQATLRLHEHERDSRPTEWVQVKPLLNVLEEEGVSRLDAMKIDVEGAEYSVLAGAEAVLRQGHTQFIFVECIDTHLGRFGHRMTDVISLLLDCDYRLFGLRGGRWLAFDSDGSYRQRTGASSDVVALQAGSEALQKFERRWLAKPTIDLFTHSARLQTPMVQSGLNHSELQRSILCFQGPRTSFGAARPLRAFSGSGVFPSVTRYSELTCE